MTRYMTSGLILIGLVSTGFLVSMAAERPLSDIRKDAEKLYKDGQYKEALVLFKELTTDAENSGDELTEDIRLAVGCLSQLQKLTELDALLEDVIESHPDDWRAFWASAQQMMQTTHYGYIVGGEYLRGNRRGGGQYASSMERDRVQALKWMFDAHRLKADNVDEPQSSNFYK